MSKKITQKVRELLTPEDLKVFESAMENMVESRVSEKLSDLIKLKEADLVEKYDAMGTKFVAEEVEKRITEEKAKIVESYDKKLSLLEKKVASKLGTFLDQIIVEQISDEMLEKIAINETLEPVVEGIRKVFGENYLKINSNSQHEIDKVTGERDATKAELSESIEKRMELEGKLEQSAVYLLISEKTNGLKKSDKQTILESFRDKEFDVVEKDIDNYITLIKESVDAKVAKKTIIKESKKSVKDKMASVNEGSVVETKKEKIVETTEEVPTVVANASRYL